MGIGGWGGLVDGWVLVDGEDWWVVEVGGGID